MHMFHDTLVSFAERRVISMEVDKALKVVVVCVECAASVVAIIKK